MLFAAKAISIKSSIFTLEKQLDDLAKNLDNDSENADEKSIVEDSLPDCFYRFQHFFHHHYNLNEAKFLSLKKHYFFPKISRFIAPIMGVFTPPPNCI
jgi:hypothetical protein